MADKKVTSITWFCSICGSDNVEERQWIHLNTGENCGGTDDSEYYCNNCEEIVSQVDNK